jgi:hypothetical protein
MVSVILIVAKFLSVAPDPHIDFGCLGFSFFFLHIFLKKMPAFGFLYIQSFFFIQMLAFTI